MKLNLREIAEASGSLEMQSTDEPWILEDLEATIALGKTLAKQFSKGKILLLQGPLGAGKTSFIKGIALAFGINEPITSPTFALAQHYPQGTPPLIHLDLYRLERPKAADELFLQEDEEAKALNAFMAIEWPERLGIQIPEAWHLNISHLPNGGRLAQLNHPTSW